MKYRKLRIAFSATCLIACVLLIVMWVRSNYWVEQVFVPIAKSTYFVLGSMPNAFGIGFGEQSPTGTWAMGNMPTAEWLAAVHESSQSWSGATLFRIDNGGVMMPYWLGVLLPAPLAAAPWVRWRFSLRTLLIATTLVAILLGLIVWLR